MMDVLTYPKSFAAYGKQGILRVKSSLLGNVQNPKTVYRNARNRVSKFTEETAHITPISGSELFHPACKNWSSDNRLQCDSEQFMSLSNIQYLFSCSITTQYLDLEPDPRIPARFQSLIAVGQRVGTKGCKN